MPDLACPLPADPTPEEEAILRRLVAGKRIAVVGLSPDPQKPSYGVADYLRSVGKEVIPVNPGHAQIMGLRCYASLGAVPAPIDVVDVFRRAEACPDVVRAALAAGARGIWLQSGIVSPPARLLAAQAGVDYVENRCLMVEHRRQR